MYQTNQQLDISWITANLGNGQFISAVVFSTHTQTTITENWRRITIATLQIILCVGTTWSLCQSVYLLFLFWNIILSSHSAVLISLHNSDLKLLQEGRKIIIVFSISLPKEATPGQVIPCTRPLFLQRLFSLSKPLWANTLRHIW